MGRIFTFIHAVQAGIAISIGGTAFLSIENRVAGAVFFTVGLFIIVTLGQNLYTGKVCYIFEKDREFCISVPIIWLGNLLGAWMTGMLLRLTRIGPGLAEKAGQLCTVKLNDSVLSIFILSVFCNILIYIAVENFNSNRHEIGKYAALFLGVPVFILCGFEHCVANMYYFSVAAAWSGKAFLYLLVMTAGNAVGGWIFPVVRRLKSKYAV
mgnify:CR=1 FL=1